MSAAAFHIDDICEPDSTENRSEAKSRCFKYHCSGNAQHGYTSMQGRSAQKKKKSPL